MLNNQKTLLLMEDLGAQFATETSKEKRRYGLYKCFCGNSFKAQINAVKAGNTQSCGCLKTIHGMRAHRLYKTWDNIIQRTSNPKHLRFKDYGGRGIVVCARWLDIKNFIEDMYPTFEEGLTIDRINNDLGYNKENCRWACKSTQSRNSRRIILTNTSGYRGVHFNKSSGKWVASIGINNKKIHLGYFNEALEAAMAYDKYIVENKLEHTINGVI